MVGKTRDILKKAQATSLGAQSVTETSTSRGPVSRRAAHATKAKRDALFPDGEKPQVKLNIPAKKTKFKNDPKTAGKIQIGVPIFQREYKQGMIRYGY